MRLCALVLSADKYRKKIEFLPDEKNVEPGCVRKKVEYLYEKSSRENGNISRTDVWMIPCKAEYIPKRVPILRYLVRGKNYQDEFFICGDTQNEGFTFVEGIIIHSDSSETLPVYM